MRSRKTGIFVKLWEWWDTGRLEGWNIGRMEEWNKEGSRGRGVKGSRGGLRTVTSDK